MKNTNLHSGDSLAPGWRFWIWLATTVSLLVIIAILVTAWAVQNVISSGGPGFTEAQSDFILEMADFSETVKNSVKEIRSRIMQDPVQLLYSRKAVERPQWVRRFPAPEDSGYLLFSGVDSAAKHALVKLIRISDGVAVATWDPDWPEIFSRITSKPFVPAGSPYAGLAIHPLLLADGDVVFNTASSLVRLNSCARKPVWVLDEPMHHSVEIDESGSILALSVAQEDFTGSAELKGRTRDDALARVSIDGKLLERRSFLDILHDNDLDSLWQGNSGISVDPIHLNQVQVAKSDSRYWMRGDLLISSRNISTVFLYRPSTGKIIWHKTGPWLNQHSADFVGDHQISVFDNNVIAVAQRRHMFRQPGDINRVFYTTSTRNWRPSPTRPCLQRLALSRCLKGGRVYFPMEVSFLRRPITAGTCASRKIVCSGRA